ncbi:hemerythrin domain-containing protein [Chryseobacterium sp. SSA4.19]|uniref:hemerythrin domain-containing protein n=1 Tax=Chryseobacterium sp. SSA4.19 TaxID=2919915 RepID=UPI001F4E987D|nr:hemerythrin domain-containing protein [Chryseobacterium sp. SSA4.19]MCJ8154547.1 hemerythrin domain-containing protein [Chryseobacterium sp. SSA4.19]
MKRNENLVPLSRDHHFGLLCCWKIRQGIKKDISYERIRKYINFYWEKNLSGHFEIEDTILPEVKNNNLQIQMENEHREINRLINNIKQSDNKELLADFADLLYQHIRFEERTVFPHLEEHLSADQLSEIGAQLDGLHHKEQDDYPDEFWK